MVSSFLDFERIIWESEVFLDSQFRYRRFSLFRVVVSGSYGGGGGGDVDINLRIGVFLLGRFGFYVQVVEYWRSLLIVDYMLFLLYE